MLSTSTDFSKKLLVMPAQRFRQSGDQYLTVRSESVNHRITCRFIITLHDMINLITRCQLIHHPLQCQILLIMGSFKYFLFFAQLTLTEGAKQQQIKKIYFDLGSNLGENMVQHADGHSCPRCASRIHFRGDQLLFHL